MRSLQNEAWEILLAQMENEGISFYINGKRSNAKDVVMECCVCEEAVYMPDFVTDEKGKLREVRYDEVKGW
ncbi:MAG: hypothetical protein IJ390_01560 [Lachnospiraceae bacterium]|nr:hypothetical protein [Lachnospiraceae bacterium]